MTTEQDRESAEFASYERQIERDSFAMSNIMQKQIRSDEVVESDPPSKKVNNIIYKNMSNKTPVTILRASTAKSSKPPQI